MKSKYIFYAEKFKEKLKLYKDYAIVYYPCKVNLCYDVVKIVDELNCGFEIDSINVLKKLISKYGVLPEKILFNGLIRNENIVQEAINYGVTFFAIDSMESLEMFSHINCQGISFLIRISINSLLESNINKIDKWGTSVETAIEMANYIRNNEKYNLSGFSFYFPQEVKTLDRIIQSIKRIEKIDINFENKVVDIGGGISLDELKLITKQTSTVFNYIIEPGRHLVGDCFDMICNIISYKKVGSRYYVFTDVGIYSGFIDVIIKEHEFIIQPLCNDNSDLVECIICGCTSDISDVFGNYMLPINTIVNNSNLIIRSCGAYCPEMFMQFSGQTKYKIFKK